ncbi:MAG TPA: hypothetical protein VLH84_04740 [Patescibacteria group bacterium]|nr:hypothetical protein [Patescibacteria group bacterium]
MNTTIRLVDTANVDALTEQAVYELAAQGFEQPNDDEMRADTIRHIRGAEALQVAYQEQGMVAFSLYGRSLWRPSSRALRHRCAA